MIILINDFEMKNGMLEIKRYPEWIALIED